MPSPILPSAPHRATTALEIKNDFFIYQTHVAPASVFMLPQGKVSWSQALPYVIIRLQCMWVCSSLRSHGDDGTLTQCLVIRPEGGLGTGSEQRLRSWGNGVSSKGAPYQRAKERPSPTTQAWVAVGAAPAGTGGSSTYSDADNSPIPWVWFSKEGWDMQP